MCLHSLLILTCPTFPCRHAGVVPCFALLRPLFISLYCGHTVVGDPIIKREMVWDPINMFYTATFWCLSQTRTWISNAICHGLFVFNDLRWQMVVHFVDNGGVDHHCLIFFYPLANEVAMGYSNATVRPSVASLWTL